MLSAGVCIRGGQGRETDLQILSGIGAYDMNTEIIAFASAAGVFRKKTPENQRKAWDELSGDFAAEFDRDPTCLLYTSPSPRD